jgi:hypothetical protein
MPYKCFRHREAFIHIFPQLQALHDWTRLDALE